MGVSWATILKGCMDGDANAERAAIIFWKLIGQGIPTGISPAAEVADRLELWRGGYREPGGAGGGNDTGGGNRKVNEIRGGGKTGKG